MTTKRLCRPLALLLAFVMVLTLADIRVFADDGEGTEDGVTWEELDPSEVGADLLGNGIKVSKGENPLYEDTDQVRAIIVMDNTSTYSLIDSITMTKDPAYKTYRETMPASQAMTAARITNNVMDGEQLDVVWSFDIIANAIAVNVEYGKLAEIAGVRGVRHVYLEQRYEWLDESNNTISQQMTGVDGVRSTGTGYYGAGTSVAVIDTGLEIDHISFDPQAYRYALEEDAAKAGKTYDEYVAGLDMITKDTIAACLTKLHAYERNPKITANDLYQNEKVPFAFNYVNATTDVAHAADPDLTAGNEHGSHVAGISAANRYLPASRVYDLDGDQDFDEEDARKLMRMALLGEPVNNPLYTDISGDGDVTAYDAYLLLLETREGNIEEYVSAADSVHVDGVAPDAQIVAMNVFAASGGAYSSDYIAALEDAITLGCDVSNLSLGSPQPGFSVPHMEVAKGVVPDENGNYSLIDDWINGVFEKAEAAGMVVSISAGNNGNWADYDDAYQLLYTDEGGVGNLGAPASYTSAFSVGSVDNQGYFNTVRTVAADSSGNELELRTMDFSGSPSTWADLDPNGVGSTYSYIFLGDPTNLLNGAEQTDMSVYAGTAEDFSQIDCAGKIVLVARGNMVSFIDKHQNAAAAGALAVIVYNNEDGDVNGTVAGDETTPGTTAKIPIAGITLNAAKKLYAMGTSGTLEVIQRISVTAPESETPQVSYFSSWGTTTNLSLKPEITAPGGTILSVNGANGNETEYELMSGTSMSSPHNAGLAALAADYIKADNNQLLKTAKTNSGISDLTVGALAQSLMMSTATPLIEHDGLEYSVRSQGAGLANIQAAIDAKSFLLVNGMTGGKVKAELGDRAGDKEGTPFTFSFTVSNLTSSPLTYQLSDSILTTGTTVIDGFALSTDEMQRLGANVSYTGTGVSDGVVTVPANGKTNVTVSINVTAAAAAAMLRDGYTNGFYVEGFIYLTGSDVTHSIPLLGWYGDWCDPSMFDKNSTLDLYYETVTQPSHMANVDKNSLAFVPVGSEDEFYLYTGNIYNNPETNAEAFRDGRYLEERNAINNVNPNWTLALISPTLIRSARDFQIYVTGVTKDGKADFSNIYYSDSFYDNFDRSLFASFYNGGAWYDVTQDYGIGLDWDLTDGKGSLLPEGTQVCITFVCIPEYGAPEWQYDDAGNEINRPDLLEYVDKKGTTLSWKFTIDNTAPAVQEKSDQGKDTTFTLTADNHLHFTVKDNRYVAAIALLEGSGSTLVSYYYPDMDKLGATYDADLDLSTYVRQFGKKAVIAVMDYAGNETYYGVNLNGAGSPYGEFVGFQFDGFGGSRWTSFDRNVNRNETYLFTCQNTSFTAAEYVNGVVLAQAEDGRLYGFLYSDMLASSVDLEQSYVATLENVYSDFAYNYQDGCLYGMYSFSDDFGDETHVDRIYLEDEVDEYGDILTDAYYVDGDVVDQNSCVGYTLSIDDVGNLYVLALTDNPETEEKDLGATAHLWKFVREDHEWYVSYPGTDLGDTGITLDYLQSATWNHNNEKLYWSRFIPDNLISVSAELYEVNPETAKCTLVGTLTGETAGIFAPLTQETAAKPEHAVVPSINREEYGTPILDTTSITLNLGGTARINWHFDPWYAGHKNVAFKVEDPKIASVDENGVVTGVGTGTTKITIYNTEKTILESTCTVSVASISAHIEGILTYKQGNSTGKAQLYTFDVKNGVPKVTYGNPITAEGELAGFGLEIASSAQKGSTIWASEYGNTGNIYSFDALTGKALTVSEPIDGDMMFSLAYSEDIDRYMGAMNYFLYVDIPLPLTKQAQKEMLESYDKEHNQYNWHRLDLSPWLNEMKGNLVTGEDGDTAIVISGVTNVPGSVQSNVSGGAFGGLYGNYKADTTWVLLDNVGRLLYIDEISNVKLNEYGEYDLGEYNISQYGEVNNILEVENSDSTMNLFIARDIVTTPLYDSFLAGDLSITYHFSDIAYAGDIAIADQEAGTALSHMFVFSLYNFFDEARTNDIYLYVQNRTQEASESSYMPVYSKGSLYKLGDTGENYIIATINKAEYIGGLEETSIPVTLHPGELPGASDAILYMDGTTYPEALPAYDEAICDELGWTIPEDMSFAYWADQEGNPVDYYNLPELAPGLELTAHWNKRVIVPVTFRPGELQGATDFILNVDSLEYPYIIPIHGSDIENEFGWAIPEDLTFAYWTDQKGNQIDSYDELPELTENLEFTAHWNKMTGVTYHPDDSLKVYGITKDVTLYYVADNQFYPPNESKLGWYDVPYDMELVFMNEDGEELDYDNWPELKEGLVIYVTARPVSYDFYAEEFAAAYSSETASADLNTCGKRITRDVWYSGPGRRNTRRHTYLY